MTDHEHENAQLAAWLAGDLDDAEASALEQRLDAEPGLGARLDAMAATLARLRRYDAVELPPGTAGRLRARLIAERSGPTTDRLQPRAQVEDRTTRDRAPATGDGRLAGSPQGPVGTSPAPGATAPEPVTPTTDATPGTGTTTPGTGTATPGPAGAAGAGGVRGRTGEVTRPPGRAGTRSPGAERPGRQRARRARLAGIAAAVLVVVVGIGGLLPLLNRGDDASDSAAFEVAAGDGVSEEALVEEESAQEFSEAAEDSAEAVPAPEASEEERAAAEAAPPGPVVVDAGAPLGLSAEPPAGEQETAEEDSAAAGGGAALADRFLRVPEAQALLGLPLDEARETARAFVAELQTAPALASVGSAPSACLDVVGLEDTAVPVRVEGFTFDGAPALAYVVVRATPGAQVLDTVQVVVTDPRTCAVVAGS